ncbi:uncharacterized protein VNE69_03092 [Vairimorpha necatrix]|uniref:Membrane protein n=1 Tax=Vairimorpha necatrix TaxID=6039 RepID=A0AAX4JA80_9MICR
MSNQKIQVHHFNQRQKKLNDLLFEDQSLFLITPLQVLIISLVFIANVFLLHIVSRFIPSTTAPQVAISIIVIIFSIIITFCLNKKR